MATAEVNTPAAESYNARVQIDGAHVSVQAPSLTVLAALIARLKGAPSEGTPVTPDGRIVEKKAAVGAAEKQEVAQAAAGKPKANAQTAPAKASSESAPAAGEPASPAPSQAASTPAADEAEKPVGYEDVKQVVNALYAIKPQHAVDLLAAFGVTKGPELQPQQWPDVVKTGRAKLVELKGA